MHLFFFFNFHLKTFQSEPINAVTENMAHPKQWPFVQAIVPLQKKQRNKHFFAFELPRCRTKAGTGFFSLSKLLPHRTQALDISRCLHPWTHQPGLSAALWRPFLLANSLQPKPWSLWVQLCSLLRFTSVNPPGCAKKSNKMLGNNWKDPDGRGHCFATYWNLVVLCTELVSEAWEGCNVAGKHTEEGKQNA